MCLGKYIVITFCFYLRILYFYIFFIMFENCSKEELQNIKVNFTDIVNIQLYYIENELF